MIVLNTQETTIKKLRLNILLRTGLFGPWQLNHLPLSNPRLVEFLVDDLIAESAMFEVFLGCLDGLSLEDLNQTCKTDSFWQTCPELFLL